jgi:hypothetical protein
MKKTQRMRSGPVYVESERGTISLVFEANVREALRPEADKSLPRLAGRPDVYIIDGDGVRQLRRENRLIRALVVGVIISALLWALSRVLEGRE